MILGTGIDLVDVHAFAALVAQADAPFVRDHFTRAEQEYCERGLSGRVAHYAARYAAKEACVKAVDASFLHRQAPLTRVNHLELEVVRDPLGRPYFILHGAWAKLCQDLQATIFLSMAHDGPYAIAQVILDSRPF